jgi:hypothetical protein
VYSQLITNIKINFKFYRRNRLLLVASIFIILVLGLSTIPAIFFLTKTKHLEIIRIIFSELSWFTTIITAGLGLLLISHHIRNRSTKMVFTKPCPPDIWLLSSLLSASIVSLVFYTGIFLVCSTLFIAWNIPFQWGIFYISFNDFLQTIIILSYITFLTVLFHPVIAVLFIFIFREGTFYFLKILLMSGIKAAGESSITPCLKLLKGFVDIIYMILPTFNPYSEKTSQVYSSLRISDADWGYLLLTFLYTLSASALFYLLSDYFLKKKRHI